jgi:hypothetical protein
VHERPCLGIEDVAFVGLIGLGRLARDAQELWERQQRPLVQDLQFPWNRRAEQEVIVTDDGIADDTGEAAAEPERHVGAQALVENEAGVRRVGGNVRIDRPLLLDFDVGAQDEIVRIGRCHPNARRTDRASFLPVLWRERAHAVLVLQNDHGQRLIEVRFRPRPQRRRRAAHLLELPDQLPGAPFSGIRHDREVRALDLDPLIGRRNIDTQPHQQGNGQKRDTPHCPHQPTTGAFTQPIC